MNLFGLSGLLVFITNISMGIFVLIKAGNILSNRLWAYFTFSVALWGYCAFNISFINDPSESLIWWKLAHIGILTIPITFFHFTQEFLNNKIKFAILFVYLGGAIFLLLLINGLLISKVKWMFNSMYYVNTETLIYSIFLCIWIFVIYHSHYILYSRMLNENGKKRNQIKYFFLATSIGFSGGLLCFLPMFSINLYPYGNFAVAIYPLIMTFAILKYNLLDINIILRRSIVYSILIAIISSVYLLSAWFLEHIIQKSIGYNSLWVGIIITFIIGLLFNPIRNKIQFIIDKYFFKASHEDLFQQNTLLRQEIIQTERLKAVAVLASGMAHEIKNPLTALKTFTEYLPKKIDDKEFLKKYSIIVTREVNRIDALVHELLDFAKPAPIHLIRSDIHPLINQTLDFLNNDLIKYRIKLSKNFVSSENLLLNIDLNQLKQALLNILLNAIEAMPSGGELSISTAFSITNEQFILKIQDSGNGIATEHLAHIFDPFFTKKDQGTGLGLSITHEIIKNHGGRIFVESPAGKGATFIIELPYNSPL